MHFLFLQLGFCLQKTLQLQKKRKKTKTITNPQQGEIKNLPCKTELMRRANFIFSYEGKQQHSSFFPAADVHVGCSWRSHGSHRLSLALISSGGRPLALPLRSTLTWGVKRTHESLKDPPPFWGISGLVISFELRLCLDLFKWIEMQKKCLLTSMFLCQGTNILKSRPNDRIRLVDSRMLAFKVIIFIPQWCHRRLNVRCRSC